MSDLDSLLEQFKQPRGAALPPEADQPPLFAELLGGDTERAIHLLQDGADAHHTLPCGLTALHAAVLGGVAGAVPALVAAGVPVDAQLTAPQLLPKNYGEKRSPEAAPAGSTALTLACAVGKPASVQALLAAGAAYQLPTLNADSWGGLFADTAASPWFWAVQWRGARSEAADAAAVRASLLEHVLQRAAAGTLQLQPEQLMALLAVAALAPARTDQLAALAALPGAADKLDTAQRRRLAGLVVKRGDAEAVHALQAGPLRQQPIDPHGSLLQDIANNRRSDALPMASALLQVRDVGQRSRCLCVCFNLLSRAVQTVPSLATHVSAGPAPCLLVQHGTSITLTAINNVVNERTNAPLLELILSSGLPLPKVPRGSKKRSVAMWDGEYGSPEDVREGGREELEREAGGRGRREGKEGEGRTPLWRRGGNANLLLPDMLCHPLPQFHNVCCPFYTLFRRCAKLGYQSCCVRLGPAMWQQLVGTVAGR